MNIQSGRDSKSHSEYHTITTKQLSLNNLGVQELDAKEMVEVDGGIAWIAIVGAIIYVYNNRKDFAEGFKEGVAEHYQD